MKKINKQADITYKETKDIPREKVIRIYQANEWSSANKPEQLYRALLNSDSLVSAWKNDVLIGIGNAISDGHLVVYYPHLLILPDYQGQGIGSSIMERLMSNYDGFHQHMLVADAEATGFYKRCGFTRAGSTVSMWIYDGDDH